MINNNWMNKQWKGQWHASIALWEVEMMITLLNNLWELFTKRLTNSPGTLKFLWSTITCARNNNKKAHARTITCTVLVYASSSNSQLSELHMRDLISKCRRAHTKRVCMIHKWEGSDWNYTVIFASMVFLYLVLCIKAQITVFKIIHN